MAALLSTRHVIAVVATAVRVVRKKHMCCKIDFSVLGCCGSALCKLQILSLPVTIAPSPTAFRSPRIQALTFTTANLKPYWPVRSDFPFINIFCPMSVRVSGPTEIYMLRSSIRLVMAPLPRRASLRITLDDCMIGSSTVW